MSAVTYTIRKEGGARMPVAFGVASIDIRHEVGRIPGAEIRIVDGDPAKQAFPAADDPFFDPGSAIEILLRYEDSKDEEVLVFKGMVVRQAIESSATTSHLVVGLKGTAVKLTGTRKTLVHTNKTDEAILRELLGAANVAPGTIAPCTVTHETMVQYDCSDWDFIVMRAEALGMLVTVEADKVSVRPMQGAQDAAGYELTWGIHDAYEIELDANAEHPYQMVEGVGWDHMSGAVTPPSPGASTAELPPRLTPATLAPMVGRAKQTLMHLVPSAPTELKSWADARLARSHLSLLRGRIGVPGRADIKLLDWINVDGVGKRLGGSALVSGIRHRLDASGWRTDFQLGLSPERHCHREDIADVPAAGLLPPARGLQIGTVAFVPEPSDEPGLRVKVNLLQSSGKEVSVWARCLTPDMGAAHGVFFRPQMGDEVLLGFLQDDPRHPVILGSLMGPSSQVPKLLGAADNATMGRGIMTTGGSKIRCVDSPSPSVLIETRSQHQILIDEARGEIRLALRGGASITLGAAGITIDAGAGNLILKGAKVDVS